jgi:hypothetical protein
LDFDETYAPIARI